MELDDASVACLVNLGYRVPAGRLKSSILPPSPPKEGGVVRGHLALRQRAAALCTPACCHLGWRRGGSCARTPRAPAKGGGPLHSCMLPTWAAKGREFCEGTSRSGKGRRPSALLHVMA